MTQARGMFHLISRQLHRAMKCASLHAVHGAGRNATMVDRIARAEPSVARLDEFLPIEKRLAARGTHRCAPE